MKKTVQYPLKNNCCYIYSIYRKYNESFVSDLADIVALKNYWKEPAKDEFYYYSNGAIIDFKTKV